MPNVICEQHRYAEQRVTVASVGAERDELRNTFTGWYVSETKLWQQTASKRLVGFPDLVEDAVQAGYEKGLRQLNKPESSLTRIVGELSIGQADASKSLRRYMCTTVANAAHDLRDKYGGDDPLPPDIPDRPPDAPAVTKWMPEIAHWADGDSGAVRVLLVLRGVGVPLESPTRAFLGSFDSGAILLAGFRVQLTMTAHRNRHEWVQVVDLLAADLEPHEIKSHLGLTQGGWARRRDTVTDKFIRWRDQWLGDRKDREE